MKFKSVRQGEQAIVYNHLGEGRIIEGPQRLFLFRERLHRLTCYSASQYQYLEVTCSKGDVKHMKGPCQLFLHPLEHQRVEVKDAVKVDSHHIIVVYHRNHDNSVERRIVQGPTLFCPEAGEWLHQFKWHGQDPQTVGHMVMDQCTFTQLAVIPAQFYYNVRDVRTIDDTLLTVKLMIFYEPTDIVTMLDTTHDPIADIINAVCADVIAFAGKINFQTFLQQTSELSKLESYKQLTQRSLSIGFAVSKVVYRGYKASDQLQMMQDSAISSRTELRISAELEDMKQKLANLKLNKEQERAKLKQEIWKSKVEHTQKMETAEHSHQKALKQEQLDVELECERLQHDHNLDMEQKKSEQQVEFLTSLHRMDADVTKYLVSRARGRVHEEIRLIPNDLQHKQRDVALESAL